MTLSDDQRRHEIRTTTRDARVKDEDKRNCRGANRLSCSREAVSGKLRRTSVFDGSDLVTWRSGVRPGPQRLKVESIRFGVRPR